MSRRTSDYIEDLKNKLEPHADPEYAVKMKAYLRNHFQFLGIRSQERNTLFKEFFAERGLPEYSEVPRIIDCSFSREEREYHYFAIELTRSFRKKWDAGSVELFESMAVRQSWWDTVDYINSACLRPYFRTFPEGRYEITDRWVRSGNIWLQRLSVIFQLGYKENTDIRLLERNIRKLEGSDEFFVQKAIGWALRSYARTDPGFVREFVARNNLKPLSRREALKHLK